MCYFWIPELVFLHLISDTLIGLSYVAISATLTYLVYRTRRDIPFQWVFLAFGLFIVACGATHFMEVWTIWNATYWLSGYVKLITAVASVATAIVLPPLIPKTLALVQAAKLSEERKVKIERAHEELEVLYGKTKELDELKTQFFANVSHELRTPLALILGPAEKLLTSNNLNEEQRRSIENIERNAQSLLKHVNDLLDVSKLEAGALAVNYLNVDLATLVRRTAAHFESLSGERNINFSVEAPESLPAEVDADKLARVFVNLFSNAFKFTPHGGQIRCLLYKEGARAMLIVQDNGPGVPLELRDVIFERFRQAEGGSTRRFGGTGLGLAIVKDFVELHGGAVTVGEAPEGGATFTVKLPLTAPSDAQVRTGAAESNESEEIARQTLAELRSTDKESPGVGTENEDKRDGEEKNGDNTAPLVLIIEDNTEMSKFINESLASEYRTATASDGQQGLEKAFMLRPDLVISDVMMPRMSGDQFVREMRTHSELDTVPIVMLTAKADDKLRVSLLREGAQDYLMKPFSVEELRVRVGNLIAMKRAREVLQEKLASQSEDLEGLANEVAVLLNREQKARRSAEEANRLKDEFLAVVSHELRTPLTPIFGWTRMLRTMKCNDAVLASALETIERNARTQEHIINDLLDVSRIVTGNLRLDVRPLELASVIEPAIDIVRPTAEAKNIRIETIVNRQTGMILGDADRLQQVVWNLLFNAVKFTTEGGRIDVHLQQSGSCVELIISDTGQGISPDFLPHVFDRFRQADSSTKRTHGGLGLGLSIVRHLTEMHGGTVQADSSGEGEGATFTVKLPLITTPTGSKH
jgi:signal transduction histidine kinase